jgi:hypothetical protein
MGEGACLRNSEIDLSWITRLAMLIQAQFFLQDEGGGHGVWRTPVEPFGLGYLRSAYAR